MTLRVFAAHYKLFREFAVKSSVMPAWVCLFLPGGKSACLYARMRKLELSAVFVPKTEVSTPDPGLSDMAIKRGVG
jgi:hypothetical protein